MKLTLLLVSVAIIASVICTAPQGNSDEIDIPGIHSHLKKVLKEAPEKENTEDEILAHCNQLYRGKNVT